MPTARGSCFHLYDFNNPAAQKLSNTKQQIEFNTLLVNMHTAATESLLVLSLVMLLMLMFICASYQC